MSPADFADLRRQNPKQQNSINLKQTVFLCEIMQLAAFLCVICAICGRIFTQEYSINPHRRNPNVSRRFRRFTQTNNKQQNSLYLKQIVFLCVIMQLAAFLCVICVIYERIFTRVLNLSTQMKTPVYLPQISQIYADKNPTTTTITTKQH
jgi:hypothetical protein